MPAMWVAAISAVAGVGLSVAAAASAEAPDYAKATRRGLEADLRTLPGRRAVEAAARIGGKAEYNTGKFLVPIKKDDDGWDFFGGIDALGGSAGRELAADVSGGTGILGSGSNPREQSNIEWVDGKPYRVINRQVKGAIPHTRTVDFTGMGQADIQRDVARAMARSSLDIQKKYGAEFIDEAKRQQELADPEGTEARKLLHGEILREADRAPEIPVAELLEQQVMAELESGQGLDADTQAILEQVMARRAASGDAADGSIEEELVMGLPGEERARGRRARAGTWLGSGQTPRDAQYRHDQQTMANMGSFIGGRSPQAQFGQLASAQQGAAPVQTGAPLPGLNAGAGQQNAMAQAQFGANQVNDWLFGLNALVQGANIAGAAGAGNN